MKRFLTSLFFYCFIFPAGAQWQGKVVDAVTAEPLSSATVVFFSAGKKTWLMANKEGIFSVPLVCDSLKISMVGYRSATWLRVNFATGNHLEIQLQPVAAELSEVVIKKTSAVDIIQKVMAAIPSFTPVDDFESRGFYREIIKDRENYFSVAEAVFDAQYFPQKESYKLKLIKGRSKEDVAYTRLFEDYHPGGGPQSAVEKSFITGVPDFLNKKKIRYFNYKIDSLVQFDGRWLYSISFDQQPGVKQALEKGRLLIDADGFSVLGYEAENSPLGTPYIKDLTGSDKIFAGLLNIDFKRKGWKYRVDFTKAGDKWLLGYAAAERKISYKQPKKKIDLDLTISTEMLLTGEQLPVIKEITSEEEWKRKNLAVNLPLAFDPAFWGGSTIILPTQQVKNIVESISKSNKEAPAGNGVSGWQSLNPDYFVSFQKEDTIVMIPVMKCWWEDEKSGGMLFQEMQGNFSMETKISLSKNSLQTEMPDKGFQQAGIMIRKTGDIKENYIFLSIGTAGNPVSKIIYKKTAAGKSKISTAKNGEMKGWFRLEKKGNKLSAWYKKDNETDWEKKGEYETDWLNDKIQLGLAIYGGFPGDGPKMKPDIKAVFTQIKISLQ